MGDMTLIEAAATLGKSYNATLRLVLTRELHGERRDGRWFCDRRDVARLAGQLSTEPLPVA